MLRVLLLVIVAIALPAVSACHDAHEFDLTLGPYLTLVHVSPTSVTIAWEEDYSKKAKHIRVERKKRGKQWNVIDKLPPDARIYTDDTVGPGNRFRYRLNAFLKPNGAERSVELKVDTPEEEPEAMPLTVEATPPGLEPLDGAPRLSPDSDRLISAENGRVLVTELVSRKFRFATEGAHGRETGARWMPDGTAVVFTAEGPEGLLLHHLDLPTGDVRILRFVVVTEDSTVVFEGPDGTFLLDPEADVVIQLDGGER